MGTKDAFFEQELSPRRRGASPYKGSAGRTRMESVLWTSPSGEITSVRVHTSVDAATDPGLADRLCSGTLNWIRYAEDGELYAVPVPVVYHDSNNRLFVLVLPESYRCRELEERAALLERLASDKQHPVPRYVYEFKVAFGHHELAELVDAVKTPRVETTPVRPPPARYLEREEAYARSKDTVPRAADPASGAFSGPSADHDDEAQKQGRTAKALLQADAAAILEQMESMEGWPTDSSPAAQKSHLQKDEADPEGSAAEGGPSGQPTEEAEEPGAEKGEAVLEPEEAGAQIERDEASSPALEEASSEPTPREKPDKPSEDDEDEKSRSQSPASRQDELGSGRLADRSPMGEIEDLAAQQRGDDLPEPLRGWLEGEQTHEVYVEGDLICFAARLSTDELEPFLGTEVETWLQLHHAPTFPLTVLTVISGRAAQHWVVNVLDETHLEILERLAKDFRFRLDFYDLELSPVVRREVHAPLLEENARLLRKRAMQHLTDLGDADPDLDQALQLWRSDDYARLGSEDHPFDESSFGKTASPAEALEALEILVEWTDRKKEDYLLFVKSFPFVWWRKIKDRVIRAALEQGLWLPQNLREWALSKGFATSKKDMIRTSLANFTHVTAQPKNDLDFEREAENWSKLLDEAERLGVPAEPEAEARAALAQAKAKSSEDEKSEESEGQEATPEPTEQQAVEPSVLRTASDEGASVEQPLRTSLSADDDALTGSTTEELLAELQDKATRLKAAEVLCERGEPSILAPLFEAVRKMTRQEVLKILPMIVQMGEPAELHFIEDLKSNKSFLRQGAALALGALRSGAAIDPLVDCLLTEPTGIWREVARVLGEIGPGTLMTLATRLRSANAEGKERIALAMAHVAVATHPKDPLEDLAESRDSAASAVARRAYELLEEARQASGEFRRPEMEGESVVTAFTRRFLSSLVDDERELTEADIIEAEDIVDQDDIIEEHSDELES